MKEIEENLLTKQPEKINKQEVVVTETPNKMVDFNKIIAISNSWIVELINYRIDELNSKIDTSKQLEIPKEILQLENPIKSILDEISGKLPDYILLALALCSKIFEKHLDILIALKEKRPEIGGVVRRINNEFVPTIKTATYLYCGFNEIKYTQCYEEIVQSRLIQEEIIELIKPDEHADIKNYLIRLNDNYLRYITNGIKPELGLTPGFPAQLLKTSKSFNELILKDSTQQQLEDILIYAKHQKELFIENSNRYFSKGFIGLFWGPPGTGKSLTASVIGNELGIDVYRIDLSRIVSKYIGETEKNLEKIFQRFDGKNCILFFDEADALFGKRSDVKEAKDRYANQEVSYLLQRVETFSGLVILASNLKENMDEAFKRRVLSYVYFPRPAFEERLKLWYIHLPNNFQYESESMISLIAERYELTGSHIANIVKLSCLRALNQQTKVLSNTIIEPYILDIYKREGLNKAPKRSTPRLRS